MIQKNNINIKDCFWVWYREDKEGNIVSFERFLIKNHATTEKYLCFTFILHKPNDVEGFDKWLFTEVKTGACAAVSDSFNGCIELFKEYKKKTKTEIFIDIAKSKNRIKNIEDRWKENQ